ncbi:hypothetical protein WS62_23410 [Burkholderia sp. ABCPW 14]|uniref:hypothetical protein n=1 Tax=Burkholderia sp. ABCPW 14 TaxID=1637860 RepID=UPI000770D858|nr:hypothetical protein [Burkholderia sp. ABCPW 14]KVD81907.1 hypothetical protein WS62_23410 [Burkholderia sp. ABCPW 14]
MTELPNPLTDAERELRIHELGESMVAAESKYVRAILWQQMRELIVQRSQAQVERMEKQKGLR